VLNNFWLAGLKNGQELWQNPTGGRKKPTPKGPH